ncbi:glycosyltransferase family 2 protein [Thermovenabulum sp.]|uniref:glycosyltransferase family 2 protein n=2 Tax=Thermovenabulum sp. TaxID=3100335 RepID=UPI003C79AD5D
MRLSVVIPAYNEEKNIQFLLRSLKKIIEIDEIIVVDDGSRDRTGELAEKEGVKVIPLKKNYGKGYACFEGFKESRGEVVLFLDADIKFKKEDILALIAPIFNNEADMTVAGFNKFSGKTKGGFGMVKNFARIGLFLFTGIYFHFPLSGQRAVKREFLKDCKFFSGGYGMEVGITIEVIKRGGRVKEIITNMQHDRTERNLKGFLHRGKQLLDIIFAFAQKVII